MEHPLKRLKENQKRLAVKIKEEKNDRDRYTFRHNHIAYCELRGRTREQIEKPGKWNEPCEWNIDNIKKCLEPSIRKWEEEYEALCSSD